MNKNINLHLFSLQALNLHLNLRLFFLLSQFVQESELKFKILMILQNFCESLTYQ